MPVMAKKRDTSGTPKKGDRHKGSRHTVTLRKDEYDQLALLAERNDRPLLWELRRILHAALKEEGLWPPEQSEQTEETES